MRFQTLWTKVDAAGMTLVQCSVWHWQIRGGPIIVNYYPTKGTVFVNGAARRSKGAAWTADAIVAIAQNGPSFQRGHSRKNSYGREKKALFDRSPFCCWCGVPFATASAATIEHIVPLSRGGSNRDDNLRLACSPCNQARGSSVAAPRQRRST